MAVGGGVEPPSVLLNRQMFAPRKLPYKWWTARESHSHLPLAKRRLSS